jgi:mannitol-1-phosphate/altronate dehydrogenase
VLPSIKDYIIKFGKAPKILSFSLSVLYCFYKSGIAKDEAAYLSRIENCSSIKDFLGDIYLWDEDLNKLRGFYDAVNSAYQNITTKGIKAAVKETVGV